MKRMKHARIYLLAALASSWGMAAGAAEPAAAPGRLSLDLDPPYVDGSFGFSISPPVGGTIYRQKRLTSVSDVEVVQFESELERWFLTVRAVTTTTGSLDAAALIAGITQNLGSQYTDVKVLRSDEARIDGREGLRYEASFLIGGAPWLRQQAVIRTKPTEYFAIVFVTRFEVREWAEKIFDKVVASFRILRTQAMARRIEEGLQRGRLLLQSIGDGKVKLSDRIVPESYMRFVLEGREIGTVQIQERTFTHNNRTGVHIHEIGWLFKEESITNLRHDMQLTDDLEFEKWENRVYTLPPPPKTPGQPRQLLYQLESGLRQDRQLIAAFMPRPNATELQDRVIDVEPTYASAAWHSLMPRVIDLNRPELYAFSSYNAERRGMVLRTVEVMGPAQVMIGGRMSQAFKLQDSEGLIPPINEIYVDGQGHILRVVAGPLEMVAANKQDILHRYSKRVSEAEATMRKYPVREPSPARRESPMPTPPVAPQAPGATR